MRNGLVVAALLAFVVQTTAVWAADVGGSYSAAGTNFDGSTYKGRAEITVSSNSTCRIVWHIAGADWKGVCMRANETLVAAYKYKDNIGLVYYKINENGVLDGIWTLADHDGAGKELLTPER